MRWGPKAENIPVVTDSRDLGAHLSCAKRPGATTIRQRVEDALPVAKRVASVRLDTRRLKRVLKTKVFAKVLYGVEATRMPETTASKLQCAVF